MPHEKFFGAVKFELPSTCHSIHIYPHPIHIQSESQSEHLIHMFAAEHVRTAASKAAANTGATGGDPRSFQIIHQ